MRLNIGHGNAGQNVNMGILKYKNVEVKHKMQYKVENRVSIYKRVEPCHQAVLKAGFTF